MTKGAETKKNVASQTAALERKLKLKKPSECIRRLSCLQNLEFLTKNGNLEQIDLCRSDEDGESHVADQVPNSEIMANAKKMEKKIDILVGAMESVNLKIFKESPKTNLRYKRLYFGSERKNEALKQENANLREKLEVAHAKIEACNQARRVCSQTLSKLKDTINQPFELVDF